MEDRINEKIIRNKEIIPIDKEFDIRLIDVYKSICKITYEIGKDKVENGSGFLIKLPKDGEEIYCLMTNHHVITKEMIDSKKTFKVEYEFRKKSISIKLDPNGKRFIKSDKTLDFTIIEIDDLIGKEYFLSPDTKNINYQNKDIYIIQYPGGDKLGRSEGKIIRINNYNELVHDASTKSGSSVSPIFLRDKTEVIGIHKAGSNRKEENYGTLINSIIEFIQSKNNKSKKSNENISIIKDNQKNEIFCIYNKQEDEIKLLNNYSWNIDNFDDDAVKKSYIEGKNNINEKNIEIYINNKKIKFNYKYISNERGEIKVKFIFNKLLTSTAYMFDGCSSLQSIDLSSFNTADVKDMRDMFDGCSSLQSIDLSSFNTTNVKDMSDMFGLCSSLEKRNVKIGEYGKKILDENCWN